MAASLIPLAVSGIYNYFSNTDSGIVSDVAENAVSFATEFYVNDSTLNQSKYDFSYRVFPHDMLQPEQNYNGHYMVINIAVQNNSNYGEILPPGGNGARGKTAKIFTRLPNERSKTDALRFTIDGTFANEGGDDLGTPPLTRPRFTKRIVESIALYMPNSELTWTDAQKFEDISMTGFAAGAATGAAAIAGAFIGGVGSTMVGGPLAGIGGGIAGGHYGARIADATGKAVGTASKLLGAPINPKVEVLFSSTPHRTFTFEFVMSPSTPEESKTLYQIIKTLRFHQAPELRTGLVGSFFFVPPSEFDITFFYQGKENISIPRINTCVLERIDVSYAPQSAYATFYDGYPTQVRMVLNFREVEIPHKLRILQGF